MSILSSVFFVVRTDAEASSAATGREGLRLVLLNAGWDLLLPVEPDEILSFPDISLLVVY